MDNDFDIGSLIISIILTAICYMAYPFFSTKILQKEYDEKACQKMALWNSVIVGGIFFVLTTVYTDNMWNSITAFFYYYINKSSWISKDGVKNKSTANKNKHQKDNNVVETKKNIGEEYDDEDYMEIESKHDDRNKNLKENSKLYCSNCGAEIQDSDKYCPECGESFDEDESNNKEEESISIDQKYDDLIKLKELYDKKIITKEEFEKEKKKIL